MEHRYKPPICVSYPPMSTGYFNVLKPWFYLDG